ncbi:MAG TPA: hypothetical protein VMS00_11075 [Acidimicrobiales bacterium]|nr:hypothetical protein [Acidimicrobiales bacterium]
MRLSKRYKSCAPRRRGAERRVRDDRGSIVIAMLVLLILSLLALGTIARTLGGLREAARNAHYAGALGVADGGLSDALFQIDQQTSSSSSFCVGPGSGCTLSSVPSAPGAQYRAIVPDYPNTSTSDPNEFVVQSEGIVNGVSHAIQALVERDAAAQFATFGVSAITLNGHGSNASITGGPIGSDGNISCNGGGNDGTSQQVYGGGSNNCPIPIAPPGSYIPQAPAQTCPASGFTFMAPCVPSGATLQTCPANNTFVTATYNRGVYECFGDVTFSGTVTVANPNGNDPDGGGGITSTDDGDDDDGMQVFVFPTAGDPGPTVNLAGAVINPSRPSRDFRLYVAGDAATTINPGNGSSAVTMTGLLWAPTASMTVNGGQMTFTGSIVVNTFTINGNPNLTLTYDTGLEDLLQQDWRVTDYTEIPVMCFSDNPTYTLPLTSSCPSP